MNNTTPVRGAYDPHNFVGLLSIDWGDILTPDGRAHPVDAFTPISIVQTEQPRIDSTAVQPSPLGYETGTPMQQVGFWDWLKEKALPSHALARGVAIIVAVLILAIVAARLTFSPD